MDESVSHQVISSQPQLLPPIRQEPMLVDLRYSTVGTDPRDNSEDATVVHPLTGPFAVPGHVQSITAQVHNQMMESLGQNGDEETKSDGESHSNVSGLSGGRPESHGSSDSETDSNADDDDDDEGEEEQLTRRSVPVSMQSVSARDFDERLKARTFHGVWDGEHDSGFQVAQTYLFR